MQNKKVAFFGCKETTRFLIENLSAEIKISNIITISPQKNTEIEIPDYCDLKSKFEKSIDVYHVNRYDLKNRDDIDKIKSLKIDIAFCIGWQRLIPEEILKNISVGVFGMHGSSQNLPKGRGRSPLNWSIIENRKFFYTNLFKYNPGVDDGDILDMVKFSINNKDNAETLHYKNMLSMKKIILRRINSLFNENFILKKQPPLTPTYYPKREPNDSQIDWSLDINSIERFIRAVSRPFNGSFTFIGDKKLIIYEAQIFDKYQFKYNQSLTGEVVEILNDSKFLIKCNGGLLLVNLYSCSIKIKKNALLKTNFSLIKKFKKNNKGFHDLNNIN